MLHFTIRFQFMHERDRSLNRYCFLSGATLKLIFMLQWTTLARAKFLSVLSTILVHLLFSSPELKRSSKKSKKIFTSRGFLKFFSLLEQNVVILFFYLFAENLLLGILTVV